MTGTSDGADFTEISALLQVADQALIEYIERLQNSLHDLRNRVVHSADPLICVQPVAPEAPSRSRVEGQPAEALQVGQESAAMLPMLNAAGDG